MDLKKEVESLVDSLENLGFTRSRIEKELHYSENYIDQQISKGGNKRFLKALQDLLQKATKEASASDTLLPLGNLRVTLKDHFDLLKDYNSLMKRIVETRLLEPMSSDVRTQPTEETALSRAQRKYAGMIEPPNIKQQLDDFRVKKKKAK
jgi:hypothetical protein